MHEDGLIFHKRNRMRIEPTDFKNAPLTARNSNKGSRNHFFQSSAKPFDTVKPMN
jgi:hypothetical protein